MTKDVIIEMLSYADIFRDADRKTIEKISSEETILFSKGQVISDYKHYSKHIGVVLFGTILAEEKNSGNKVVLNTLKEGNVFGVTSVFSSEEENVSCIVSKTQSEILFISEDKFRTYILEDRELNLSYIRFLTDRIRFLNKKISTFATPTTQGALSRFLLSQDSDEIRVVGATLSKQLNIGRSSLYRALRELQDINAIEYTNGVVKILSREKLNVQ